MQFVLQYMRPDVNVRHLDLFVRLKARIVNVIVRRLASLPWKRGSHASHGSTQANWPDNAEQPATQNMIDSGVFPYRFYKY